MSGIVGIVNLDGKPIDRDLLLRMTDFMTYRGPDDRNIWLNGNVGFGHTLLRTTVESALERQPCSLDGEVWIAADARVDGRAELIQKLNSGIAIETATDAELILHAYRFWGEDCCFHLLGDFAFAIWDARKQQLFCARDHFGVKPFYYARVGNCSIFGNTLNCLRIHPNVSDNLNDLAIADFLVFGYNEEFDTTAFADIRRLPPAHYLTLSKEGFHLKRYWNLPLDGCIRYKRQEDYVEHFKELMRSAVGDRLRTDRVSVAMSGGLDSTSIAAVAKELMSKQSGASGESGLRAYTIVYDRLIGDRERYYSGLVAEKLGISIDYLVADDYKLFERWDERSLQRPEPTDVSLLASSVDQFRQMAAHSRVMLNGNGGDAVLYCWGAYFYTVHSIKNWQFGRLAIDLVEYVRSHRRLPQPGVRSRLLRWLGIPSWRPTYPKWLNKDLSQRLDLPGRYSQLNCEKPPIHPVRPEAYNQLTSALWPYLFESWDAGTTGWTVEARYPFFDLRLVDYLLAIPPIPWFLHKELVRVAMVDALPELVRLRPKTPLVGDPLRELLSLSESQWVDRFEPTPDLAKYVERDAVPLVSGMEPDGVEAWLHLRPLNLDRWLKSVQNSRSQITTGELLWTQKT